MTNELIEFFAKNPTKMVAFSYNGSGFFMRKKDDNYELLSYFEGNPNKTLGIFRTINAAWDHVLKLTVL